MTTFLLNKMCLENEKKSGKRRFTTFFQKTTVLLLPNCPVTACTYLVVKVIDN